jgi:hypothetical protein
VRSSHEYDDPAVQKDWWPVTDGAAMWPIYTGIPRQKPESPAVLNSYLFQFDSIEPIFQVAHRILWGGGVHGVDGSGAHASRKEESA